MEQPGVVHSTFVVERNFSSPPEVVFTAFSNPDTVRRWFGEGDHHEVEEFSLEFRVGGTQTLRYRMNENTPVAGMTIGNQALFQEIQPNRRIVTASTMDVGGKRISASLLTFELLPKAGGSELILTNQGAYFGGGPDPRMIEEGWKTLLGKLGSELER